MRWGFVPTGANDKDSFVRMSYVPILRYPSPRGWTPCWKPKWCVEVTMMFSSNLRVPFCESTFTSNYIIASLSVHTKKNYLFLMYIMYNKASNNTPYCTHVSSYVIWRVQPLGSIPCGWFIVQELYTNHKKCTTFCNKNRFQKNSIVCTRACVLVWMWSPTTLHEYTICKGNSMSWI